MDQETIAVAPSDSPESTMVETPSEPVQNPVEPEPAQPAEPEVKLYDLPDGRKVDAETLQKEWKENFLPDYTRKSQELARAKEPQTINQTINQTPADPLADPNYQPQTYAELAEKIKAQTFQEMEEREQARIEHQQSIENEVVNQLNEIKATDPKLNENALFLHANKYGFSDLKAAHQNMKDMSELAKKVQATTAQNIAKRNDPVSMGQGASATGAKPSASNFGSAIEYLRSLSK